MVSTCDGGATRRPEATTQEEESATPPAIETTAVSDPDHLVRPGELGPAEIAVRKKWVFRDRLAFIISLPLICLRTHKIYLEGED